MKELVQVIDGIAQMHGSSLAFGEAMFCHPLVIQKAAKTEFSHGVLATVAEIYAVISALPEGRKAICDLGFEPLPQNVEAE